MFTRLRYVTLKKTVYLLLSEICSRTWRLFLLLKDVRILCSSVYIHYLCSCVCLFVCLFVCARARACPQTHHIRLSARDEGVVWTSAWMYFRDVDNTDVVAMWNSEVAELQVWAPLILKPRIWQDRNVGSSTSLLKVCAPSKKIKAVLDIILPFLAFSACRCASCFLIKIWWIFLLCHDEFIWCHCSDNTVLCVSVLLLLLCLYCFVKWICYAACTDMTESFIHSKYEKYLKNFY
jgi:hypothetical protein